MTFEESIRKCRKWRVDNDAGELYSPFDERYSQVFNIVKELYNYFQDKKVHANYEFADENGEDITFHLYIGNTGQIRNRPKCYFMQERHLIEVNVCYFVDEPPFIHTANWENPFEEECGKLYIKEFDINKIDEIKKYISDKLVELEKLR